MKIYIAGPMTGIYKYNYPAFDTAKEKLKSKGYTVVSPADLSREQGVDVEQLAADGQDWSKVPAGCALIEFIKTDLAALVDCDAIYLLPGWEKSKGATAEYYVATWLGLWCFSDRAVWPQNTLESMKKN